MKLSNKAIIKIIFFLMGNLSIKKSIDNTVNWDGIEIPLFKNDAQAAACISADLELNWAWRSSQEYFRNTRGSRARKNIPVILDILDSYRVPITWATVGHLFLNGCNADPTGLRHKSMTRPKIKYDWDGDWYVHDPATDFKSDNLWYCPDIIQEILSREVHHEIGTHSFSHIDFSENNPELIKQEIEECKRVMSLFGLKPKSLVFPYNIMGYQHTELLAELGIIAVRHRDKKFRFSYPMRTKEGIYKIFESMNLRRSNYYDYTKKAEVFLENAIKKNAVFHLWFHPSDSSSLFKKEFNSIVQLMASLQDHNMLWISTMKELAMYCEIRNTLEIQTELKKNKMHISLLSHIDSNQYGNTDVTLLIPYKTSPISAYITKNNNSSNSHTVRWTFNKRNNKLQINVPSDADSLTIHF